MDPSFVLKRMNALEAYFEELFEEFPDYLRYSTSLLHFCKPQEVELCLLGSAECGKTRFVQALCRDFNCGRLKMRKHASHGGGGLQFRKSLYSRKEKKRQSEGDIFSKELMEEQKEEQLLTDKQLTLLKRGSVSYRKTKITEAKGVEAKRAEQ